MKNYIFILWLVFSQVFMANAQKIEVLTLGTFHFNFPNLDIEKIDDRNQIDVLEPKYQTEINSIVEMMAEFKPTIIAIELSPKHQLRTDSLFNEYLSGRYQLSRQEHEQIGFRLAKKLNLTKLYCTNDWGELPERISTVMDGNDSIARQSFMDYFYHNPDTQKMFRRDHVFKTKGIIAELKESNREEVLKNDLGNYLISVFKYQTDDNEFFGVDFTTGWWFNRNLRIFRNIQKIPSNTNDRILVIYGSGHMNILNLLYDASPEYELIPVNDYLK